MLLQLMLSQRSLDVSSLFKILFLFAAVWVCSTALLSSSQIRSPVLSSLLLNPPSVIFSELLSSSAL